MSTTFKKIVPLLNRIVVRKIEASTKTGSGLIVNKPDVNSYGTVMECGAGAYDNNGKIVAVNVKVGDQVLLPDYGGLKIKLNDQEFFIYRDTDVIAKME